MLELTLRLVFSLAVVIGLLLVLARISSKRFAGRHGAAVQVLHRQALSRSAGVSLVTVGDRVLLLGVTDQQVSLITELDPSELPSLEAADDAVAIDPVAVEPAPAADASAALGGPLAGTSGFSGSVLSPQTWRQAYAAATRRAS